MNLTSKGFTEVALMVAAYAARSVALAGIAMLLLAYGKHVTGRQLGNPVLRKEAR